MVDGLAALCKESVPRSTDCLEPGSVPLVDVLVVIFDGLLLLDLLRVGDLGQQRLRLPEVEGCTCRRCNAEDRRLAEVAHSFIRLGNRGQSLRRCPDAAEEVLVVLSDGLAG